MEVPTPPVSPEVREQEENFKQFFYRVSGEVGIAVIFYSMIFDYVSYLLVLLLMPLSFDFFEGCQGLKIIALRLI